MAIQPSRSARCGESSARTVARDPAIHVIMKGLQCDFRFTRDVFNQLRSWVRVLFLHFHGRFHSNAVFKSLSNTFRNHPGVSVQESGQEGISVINAISLNIASLTKSSCATRLGASKSGAAAEIYWRLNRATNELIRMAAGSAWLGLHLPRPLGFTPATRPRDAVHQMRGLVQISPKQ